MCTPTPCQTRSGNASRRHPIGKPPLTPIASSSASRGIAFLVASNGLTATVDAAAKLMSADLHGVQVAWGYLLAIFVLTAGYAGCRSRSVPAPFRTARPGMQLLRAGLLVGCISTLFMGLAYIPIADATALSFTSPLFITLLAVPLLGERFDAHRAGVVVVGLAGVVLVVRPGADDVHWAVFLPLVSAVFFALFQIVTRNLARTENALTTLLYTGGGGVLWSSLMVGFVWRPFAPSHLAAFAIIGVLGVAAHLAMIRAFAAAEASLLAPFNYAKLVWAVILGAVLFAEWPAANVWLGSAVIVASGLYVVRRERRLAPG